MVGRMKLKFSYLKEIENLNIFSLCKEFEKLSLEDNTAGSSSSTSTSLVQPSSYSGSLLRFLLSRTLYHRCKSIDDSVDIVDTFNSTC